MDSVLYEEMSTNEPWAPGTPVRLTTAGRHHLFFVKVDGPYFRPRWLRTTFANDRRLICPSELTPRDPHELWSDGWELSLAFALLSAPGDSRLEWLRSLDPEQEPDLFALRELALHELRVVPPAPTTGPAPAPEPKLQRGWTRCQVEALRQPEGVVEPLDLAPGR